MNYIPRALEKNILEATKTNPVVMVCGPRQVGKSTMLQHIMEPDRTFVTLRTPEIRILAKEHPAQFFETYKPPILIDEFQLEPSLLDTIQYLVDEKRRSGDNSNGMFWLTGSNKFTMLKGASETLVGRCRVFEMQSLSSSELYMSDVGLFIPDKQALDERLQNFKPKTQDEVFERIYYGSMPQICSSNEYSRKDYYTEYRNLYLMRDVLEITEIEKVPDFFQFLSYMAACTSQELNYATISNALKIKTETVKKWVSLL